MNGKLSTAAVIVIALFITALSLIIFNGVYYKPVVLVLTLLACLPYYASHGNKKAVTREIWIMLTATILSTISLLLCSISNFFRPYTAVTIISGIFFGAPVGFTCGFFSALIASIAVGTGGWTVYQILTLGIIGFMSGFIGRKLVRNNTVVIFFTMLASISYSCTCILNLTWDAVTGFDFSESPSLLLHSVKWFEVYTISDIVMVILIKNLLYRKNLRMKKRFRIFEFGKKRLK